MTEPFLLPLIAPLPERYMREFRQLYARARAKDPVVFPPHDVVRDQIMRGEVIAALVVDPDHQAYIGAFLLDIDRAHDALVVTVCVGEQVHRWGHVMEQLAQQAGEQLGLSRLWVQGRRGLQPILKERGFRQKYVVYSRELSDGVRSQGIKRQQQQQPGAGLSGDPKAVSAEFVGTSAAGVGERTG